MKTFNQLTPEQQKQAIDKETCSILTAICEGAIRFDDKKNKDDLQTRINAAVAKAEKMRTPWFSSEYILDTCREDIEGMARATAEDALYPEKDEHCITGVA